MATALSPFASTKETANYARLCRLLVDVGSQALRDTFDKIHPPTRLHAVLTSHLVKAALQSLYKGKRKILNPTQWGKLYPADPSTVSSANFDVTLLIVLLRNICGLSPPLTGWDDLPPATATSTADDIARVKFYRNTVYGHATQASVNDGSFNNYWQEIRDTPLRLSPGYAADIDKLKNDCMDPDIEEHYRELLEEWKKDDDNIKDRLEEMEGTFDPTEVIDGIRQLYKTREGWLAPFPWCEEFHFHLDDIFTRLKMVSRRRTRATQTDAIVDMFAIFKPHGDCLHPRSVLIEGRPGMGKTTYCKKLVYDWATGKQEVDDSFPNVEVVLLLRCRDIKTDLWEAIRDQLLPLDIEGEIREKFMRFLRHNQSKVLLILDGLDEVPDSRLPIFSDIIQCRVLPKCHLVVTSRHETGMKVRKYCDTLLEIEGFTEQDAREFIVKYFTTMEDLAERLLKKLQNDESLKEMTANPLNTALLCLLCEDFRGNFPESRSQLYLEIVQCVLRRFVKKKGLTKNTEDLILLFNSELQRLGLIALDGLRKDSYYFEEAEFGSQTTELPRFGFLSVQLGGSLRRPCLRYGFLHKSFQEFFAGFYLCWQLLNAEMNAESVVADFRYFNELKQVLLFACGIAATQCEDTAGTLIKSITTQRINPSGNLYDENDLAFALECIKECRNEQSNLDVNMSRIFGTHLNLESVSVKTCKIGVVGASSLAEALKVNKVLKQLHLGNNYFSDAGVSPLAEALEVNATLTEMVLWNNNIGCAGASSLAQALKVNKTLTQLHLIDNNIGVDGARSLAEALKVNESLKELVLWSNNICDAGTSSLAEALKFNTALTQLRLLFNSIHDAGAESLSEALLVNTTLTQLDLYGNKIGVAGAAALGEALELNATLTQLDLYGNRIGDTGASSLVEALKHNTTLTVLNVHGNHLDDAVVSLVADALQVNTNQGTVKSLVSS
ncbi:uncharacterized protein LOC144663922 isoform X2 [Oculina patagonica]